MDHQTEYEYQRVSLASTHSAETVIRPKLKQGWEIMFSTTSFCWMRRATSRRMS